MPEILHIIFFLLALPRFSPLFCPNLGGQFPPCPPGSYAYADRDLQKFYIISQTGQTFHVIPRQFSLLMFCSKVEAIQSNIELFSSDHPSPAPFTSQHSHDHPPLERRQSNMSITSQISGHGDYLMSNLATSKLKQLNLMKTCKQCNKCTREFFFFK